jgi:hypothetical protein
LTLLGGEKIIFGQGVVADGATVNLPAGYTAAKAFATAYPHDMPSNSNIMFLIGAYVDSSFEVHLNCSDNSGHTWHGNAAVLVFAWQDNMGTVVTEAVGGGNWMHCSLSNGKIFGVGCAKNMANGSTLGLPASAGDGSTLQAMVGSSNGMYEAGSNHAQGVGTCYLDANNMVHISFNDGSGDTWPGTADVFAVYCMPATALSTAVTMNSSSQSMGAGTVQQFGATVLHNTDAAVTWSVDGIVGGDLAVGTIDAEGNYTAPNAAASHTITATSVADPTASVSATVEVWGAVILSGSVLTDDQGNIIYINGEVVFVQ